MINKKIIALVGGSFKPPTFGHLDMVKKYADMADEVKVLISNPKSAKSIRKTKTGIVITPEMSKRIWEIFINRYGLKNKVSVEISEKPSPITSVYDYIDNEIKDAVILLGSSKKDDDWKRFSSALEYFKDRDDLLIVDPKEAAVDPLENHDGIPFSATQIRDNIDDKEFIKKMLPQKLTDKDIDKIMNILSNKKIKESVKRLPTAQELFIKKNFDLQKSNISYLGNNRVVSQQAFFGPEDSICEINLIPKTGTDKDKIHLIYEKYKWNVEINNKQISEDSKEYNSLINSKFIQELEAILFVRWAEYLRYPSRMVKRAKIAFSKGGKVTYTDDEIETLCKKKLKLLKANFNKSL